MTANVQGGRLPLHLLCLIRRWGFGGEASDCTKRVLTERLVRLEIPRIGDSEDAYGRTLAYIYLDANGDGSYEHSHDEDLPELGLARTTDFSHEHRREFEWLREVAAGLRVWHAAIPVEEAGI